MGREVGMGLGALAREGSLRVARPWGCKFAKARGRRAWRARAPTKKMPRRAATQRDAAAWAVRFVAAPRKGGHPVVVAAPRGPSQGAGVALEILAGPDPLARPKPRACLRNPSRRGGQSLAERWVASLRMRPEKRRRAASMASSRTKQAWAGAAPAADNIQAQAEPSKKYFA